MSRRPWAPVLGVVVFWWIVFFLAQGADRAFLLRDAARLEPPTVAVLTLTLLAGARADLVVASLGILVALLIAGVMTAPWALVASRQGGRRAMEVFRAAFGIGCWALAVLCALVVTVDMAYYGYNRQHLDAIFFEYVDEMLWRGPASPGAAETPRASRQALEQTRAEIGEAGKWGARLAAFALVQAVVILAWRWTFRRRVEPALTRWSARWPRASLVALGVGLVAGATGLDREGPLAIARVGIPSTTYYVLAQNPIWQTVDAALLAFGSDQQRARSRAEVLMPLDEAIRVTREAVAPDGVFPSDHYPLVRGAERPAAGGEARRLNVLLVFVEALDRRYVGPRLTPYLDRWGRDTIVFDNFFANGELTHHGLFSSLCSQLSGYGQSPIKVRHTNDYLCLPSLLERAGYWTEMVIGYNRDHHQDHTALFLARNGVRQFLDEGNFPANAERMGLGVTDGALFDQVRRRIEALRRTGQPFFLTTLTLSTHHPFVMPLVHPDVAALARDPDRYPAALRYLDGELERWFTGLLRDGLLDDTLVLVLGDHGRHEVIGKGADERWLGHHLTPLYVWLPPALRPALRVRPRHVDVVASQVDLTPTILGLMGLTPTVSPFVGQDLSCVIVADCRPDTEAVLLTSHSAASARRDGILTYGVKNGLLREIELGFQRSRSVDPAVEPGAADRVRRLKALIVTSTLLVDQNRVWSWAQLGSALTAPSVPPRRAVR